MKDEVKGNIINELVVLKSKLYSWVMVDKETKKAKGVNKNVFDSMRHKEYVNVLFGKKTMIHNIKRIKSKLHRIGTYDVWKISLSYFDDKRYILDDGINSLAYFYRGVLNQ